MDDQNSSIEGEIEEHRSKVIGFISTLESMTIPSSRSGVTSRFVRDCNLFLGDIDASDEPKRADLIDFGDSCASLETRFYNLKKVIS